MLTLTSAYRVHNSEVTRLIYLPDNETLLSAAYSTEAEQDLADADFDSVLKVWRPAEGVRFFRRYIDLEPFPVLSDDGQWIAWSGRQGKLCLLRCDQAEPDRHFAIPNYQSAIQHLDFLPRTHDLLFCLGTIQQLWHWRITEPWPGRCYPESVSGLFAISSTGRELAVALNTDARTKYSPIDLWSLSEGRIVGFIPPQEDSIHRVVWHPHLPVLAVCGWWGSGIRVWDVSNPTSPRCIWKKAGTCNDIAFLPDGRFFAAWESGDLVLLDIFNNQILAQAHTADFGRLKLLEEEDQITITQDQPAPSVLAVSPNGKNVAVGTLGGTVGFYDIR